jgi:hypothetical protein
MAVFNKNTLIQVSGFDNPIIAGELVYQQKTYWNLVFTGTNSLPVNLTGATINAQIVRRQIFNLQDSRNGLTFDISDYNPPPTPVPMTISNRVDAAGSFTLVIDQTSWDVISGDPELDISAQNPVCFSGRVKIGFPSVAGVPEDDAIIFLLFLVRSDGVVNTTAGV